MRIKSSAPKLITTSNSLTTQLSWSGSPQRIVESIYGTCGCNPIGKVYRQSMPHLPGATPVWTGYTYDSLGRLLTRKSLTFLQEQSETYIQLSQRQFFSEPGFLIQQPWL